ncbi:MAG: MCE family protein [Actinomycetota bacterium]|nr:MCE family protein [Actinomycetota bacterium]
MNRRNARRILGVVLAAALAVSTALVAAGLDESDRVHLTAYFDNSNGIYPGDDVLILGVPVGRIESIEPQPEQAKISFWIDADHPVPAGAQAAILSPQLISARAIQLTPAYQGGPVIADGAVIPRDRTVVPVEWDDFREQLAELSSSLQPDGPDGQSPLGAVIRTAADNLRDRGDEIRTAVVQLSQTFSTLGDHSGDVFATLRQLSILVSALRDSTTVMRELNVNLASVSSLFADSKDEVGQMIRDLDTVAVDLGEFVAENREPLGTTGDRLASVSQALVDSLDDVEQTLHTAPTALQNLNNTYEPAHSSLTGIAAINNFANPLQFLCAAVQAASRLGAEQAAKMCVQYLAPIMKNRQYNFLPFGLNPVVNAQARPNEITYSEDWMRPDHVPPAVPDAPPPSPPLPAEATDPAAGLSGLMVPHLDGQ